MVRRKTGPSWDRLYEIAEAQDGHFTTTQAAEASYSPQLLARYLDNGRVIRIRRGIYRLVHFPAGENEHLVVLWLWSGHAGAFSHETALALHELSDDLPAKVHMTVPASWTRRRLRVPAGLVLHFADVPKHDRCWHGSVPVTAPARTLRDCAEAKVSPEIVEQALRGGLRRGLFDEKDTTQAIDCVEGLLRLPVGQRDGRKGV